jgi:hypothetical protein
MTGDMTPAEILLGLITSGGIIYAAIQHWMKLSTEKAKARLALQGSEAKTEQKLKVQAVEADLKGQENFQELITGKVIEQFLAQFNSYQEQNEKFQKFFFESLDPMISELRDNTQDVRNVLAQIDLLARGLRESTAASDRNAAAIECLQAMLALRFDISPPPLQTHISSNINASSRVTRKDIVVSSSEDGEDTASS